MIKLSKDWAILNDKIWAHIYHIECGSYIGSIIPVYYAIMQFGPYQCASCKKLIDPKLIKIFNFLYHNRMQYSLETCLKTNNFYATLSRVLAYLELI